MAAGLRWTAVAMVAVGLILVGIAQAVPWRTAEWGLTEEARTTLEEFGQETPEGEVPLVDLYAWGMTVYVPADDASEDPSSCTGPYLGNFSTGDACDDLSSGEIEDEEDPFDEADNGAVMLLLGSLAAGLGILGAIAALVVALARPGIAAAATGAASGAVLLVGCLLTTLGAVDFTDTVTDALEEVGEGFLTTSSSAGAGLFFGYAGATLCAAGGGLMFAVPRTAKEQRPPGAPTMRATGGPGMAAAQPPRPGQQQARQPAPQAHQQAQQAPSSSASTPSAAAPGTPRRLKCPRCGTPTVVPPGQKPSCAQCGFGR